MKEFPSHYSNTHTFLQISDILRAGDEADVPVNPRLMQRVRNIMTPETLLEKTEFAEPFAITPESYPDFNSLLTQRDRIRTLKLAPIKSKEDYIYYHQQSKEKLLAQINEYLADSSLAIEPNMFPYDLPDDLEQYILWMKDKDTDRDTLAETVTQFMQYFHITMEDIIIFERPLRSRSHMVRGTVPEIRHMHIWIRRNADYSGDSPKTASQ